MRDSRDNEEPWLRIPSSTHSSMSGVKWRIRVCGIGSSSSELSGFHEHSTFSINTMAQWPPWPTAALCWVPTMCQELHYAQVHVVCGHTAIKYQGAWVNGKRGVNTRIWTKVCLTLNHMVLSTGLLIYTLIKPLHKDGDFVCYLILYAQDYK